MARFDHLVVAAADLAQGARWARQTLGIEMGAGGAHPLMATHNLLTAMGGDSFLEIIAIDPAAPPPPRARWFGLDDPALQRSLAAAGPRLVAWVAAIDDIDRCCRRVPLCGAAVEQRRGALRWRISLAADGRPPAGGALPVLIQWPTAAHPAAAMADAGCRLRGLTVRHPRAGWVAAQLAAVGAETLAAVESGAVIELRAQLLAPHALVELRA